MTWVSATGAVHTGTRPAIAGPHRTSKAAANQDDHDLGDPVATPRRARRAPRGAGTREDVMRCDENPGRREDEPVSSSAFGNSQERW